MRFLLTPLLSILCLYAVAQKAESLPKTTTKSSKRWRVGLAFHADRNHNNPYLSRNFLLLPRVRRTNIFFLTADYQLARSTPALRLSAALASYDVTVGNDELRWLTVNGWRSQFFLEQIAMSYTQVGLGLRYELAAKQPFSPYVAGQLQIAFPNQLSYNYQEFIRVGSDPNLIITLDGGEQVSTGWQLDFGVRMKLSSRWIISCAYYRAYMNFQADWPRIEQRKFPDAIMRLSVGGLQVRCQYSI